MIERPQISVEYLEKHGPPTICHPAPGVYAIISGDGYETVDITLDQMKYLKDRLSLWIDSAEGVWK